MTVPQPEARHSRIPLTLQAVFLASNRGRDVNKPPPERVAYKVFFRNWLFQRQAHSGKGAKSGIFGKKQTVPEKRNLQPVKAPIPQKTQPDQTVANKAEARKEEVVTPVPKAQVSET